ncbi:MAG: siderophore-interacting protein [Myxococcota bacterium]
MAARVPRLLTLDAVTDISPNVRRLRFTGESLASFPPGFEGGYVKLQFDADGNPLRSDDPDVRPAARRSYTVRSVDPAARTLVVDAALHTVPGSTLGPATRWIANAKIGEQVSIVGPGPVKMLSPDADAVVAIADPTGLPALAVNLERLPAHAKGFAIIEVLSDEDRQDLRAPDGVDVRWVLNPAPSPEASPLYDALEAADWPQGRVSFWGAGEFHAFRRVRAFLRTRDVAADDLYVSSYWKVGSSDEQHKLAKKQDAAAG